MTTFLILVAVLLLIAALAFLALAFYPFLRLYGPEDSPANEESQDALSVARQDELDRKGHAAIERRISC